MPFPLDDENSPDPLRLTPRQTEVIATLKKHHHDPERICRWFEGALHALANKANPDRLAQAANSLREMLEKFLNEQGVERIGGDFKTARHEIREGLKACSESDLNKVQWEGMVITPALAKVFAKVIKYLADNEAPSRREQTATALASTDPLHAFTSKERQTLIRKGIIDCSISFQKFTHHDGVSGSDGEKRFMDKLGELETLLLLHFNPPMNEAMLALKKVAHAEPSTIPSLQKILQGVQDNEAVYELFFKELLSPAWVPVLEQAGFFKNPPDIREVGSGYVNFSVWWPLVFLHRVAAQVPELAVTICAGVPPIKNPRPYFEITRIAHAIPDVSLSIKLKDKLIEYADFPFHALGDEFGPVLAHWAKGDAEAHAAAVELTGRLVSFRVDPNHDPSAEGYHTSPVKPAFRESQYTEILSKGVRPLADKAPLATAKVLIGAVSQLIDLRYRDAADEIRDEADDDFSTSWCKRVDAPYDDYAEEEEELVHALTYTSEKACEKDEVSALQLDELLRQEHWKIFRRIRHHLYARFPHLFKTQIQDALLRFQGYAETEYGFEFAQLIRSACESFGAELLTLEQLTGIFDQILAGPNVEELQADERYTPETIVSRCNYVVRRHLWPFEKLLFGQYHERFSELLTGHTLSIDDYLGWGGRPTIGEIVTQSPVPEGDLAAASDDDLINTLNTWTESEPNIAEMWIRRDREGLARAFAKVVAENPARFGTWDDKWKSISQPLYLIKALEEATKLVLAEKHDQVPSWISLAERIVSKPLPPIPEPGVPEEQAESRSDWQWARTSVVSFLKACMDLKTGVAVVWRPQIWKMLRQLCRDTDFRLDDSEINPSSSDLISRAINCTRGPALESLILYAAWLEKHGEVPAISSGNQIGQVLDERFSGHPSLTWPELGLLASKVHNLHWLNPKWVEQNIGKLFRQDDFALWLPTFKAFLHYGHIRSAVFHVLRSQYMFALDHTDDLRNASTPKEKLVAPIGFHLALLFMWGCFPLTGEESLLARFYQLANIDEKSDLMTRLGQSIHHSETLDEPYVQRGIQFFEARLALAEPASTDGRKEFDSVNSWIQSKTLPPTWRLTMLRRVLLLRPSSEDFTFLTDFLADRLSTDLALVVECFVLITELGTSQRHFYIQPKEGKAILRAGVHSGDETIKNLARAAQNNLLRMSRFEFVDLDEP